MFVRAIDFETATGDEKNDAICEVGYTDVRISPSIEVGFYTAWLVNPGMPISPAARGVHHITDDELVGAMSVNDAKADLICNDPAPSYYVAHFAEFEKRLFNPEGARWLCSYKIAYRIWPEAANHKNQTLRYHLGFDQSIEGFTARAMPPHRAGPDSYTTAHIFAEAMRVALSRGHSVEKALEFFLKWSVEPMLLRGPLTFGKKHKGQEWSTVPEDYLIWIVETSDLNEDTKFTAQHELTKRKRGN